MIDMGSLGGTFGALSALNNRGQAVGWSYLPGDQLQRGIMWDRGVLTDLGTFGGSQSNAIWINDAGDIAGIAGETGDLVYPATLWSHGKMINLGTLPGDDTAFGQGVNSARQVVGTSCSYATGCNIRGFLWENDGPMVDLTALVEPPFDGVVFNPFGLNERGEIVAIITLPTLPGNFHLAVLVPDGDCDSSCEQRIAASQNAPAVQPAITGATLPAFGRPTDWLRNALGNRLPMPARPAAPSN
jgi:probable HAF family extracellular repeat protein